MTHDEVASCLRHFRAEHTAEPLMLVAGPSTHEEIIDHCAGDRVTGNLFFDGVPLFRDPMVKGIVVSS